MKLFKIVTFYYISIIKFIFTLCLQNINNTLFEHHVNLTHVRNKDTVV